MKDQNLFLSIQIPTSRPFKSLLQPSVQSHKKLFLFCFCVLPPTIQKQNLSPKGNLFRYFLLLSNNCVHNLVNLCKEILPKKKSDNTFLRPTDVLEESTPVSFVRIAKLCLACPAWGLKTVSSGGWRALLCVIAQSSYSRKSFLNVGCHCFKGRSFRIDLLETRL